MDKDRKIIDRLKSREQKMQMQQLNEGSKMNSINKLSVTQYTNQFAKLSQIEPKIFKGNPINDSILVNFLKRLLISSQSMRYRG